MKVLITHDQLSVLVAKWLKRHSQNVLIPNCETIAVDMKTIEQEKPDVIGWNGCSSTMIEVKVGRGDFLQDFKKPFRQICKKGVGQFRYYCCPSGLIKENELPDKWGLLYLNDKNKIDIIKVAEIQQANLRAERNMLISLLRRQSIEEAAATEALHIHSVIGDIISTTTVINVPDELVGRIDLVSCCKIGPITNENFCPECGKKIIR